MVLEVCSFNIQSCIIAQQVGATRTELCDNPVEGGTTPSYGAIRQTREKISIELYPIIRPRAGTYFYDENEFAMMLQDIKVCKELGCDGISIGVQKQDGNIDTDRLKRIVDLAYPLGVTCNRVFDATPDAFRALEEIIESGCERILTSGQKPAALEGSDLINALIGQADCRIILMPGSGVRSDNITAIAERTGAEEFHTSARIFTETNMRFQNDTMEENLRSVLADGDEIRKIIELLNQRVYVEQEATNPQH